MAKHTSVPVVKMSSIFLEVACLHSRLLQCPLAQPAAGTAHVFTAAGSASDLQHKPLFAPMARSPVLSACIAILSLNSMLPPELAQGKRSEKSWSRAKQSRETPHSKARAV